MITLSLISDFLKFLIKNTGEPKAKPLPIGKVINRIGATSVFIRAETGVGKTVAAPVKILIEHLKKVSPNGLSTNCQVIVVEPRVTIVESQKGFLNGRWQTFLKSQKGVLPNTSAIPELFGCISSAGKKNPNAPIIFVTTGILENMAAGLGKHQLEPNKHRVVIDEAHVILSQYPGMELAVSLIKHRGIMVDYMSATVDTSTIEDELDTLIIEAKVGERLFKLDFVAAGEPMETFLPRFVNEYLLERGDYSRPQGAFIIINSHQSEHSDTQRYSRLVQSRFVSQVEVIILASPVIKDPEQWQMVQQKLMAIRENKSRFVVITTNVIDMGVTWDEVDYVVTMDTEYYNVLRDGCETLELKQISINTLLQRGGRAGRKRHGTCFITNEYEGEDALYSQPKKLEAPKPEPIIYALEKGYLTGLALHTFAAKIDPSLLQQCLAELRLPSKIDKNPSLFERFSQERRHLQNLGLANESTLTETGQKVIEYYSKGLTNLHLARLLATVPKDEPELQTAIALISVACNESSLQDILLRQMDIQTLLALERVKKVSLLPDEITNLKSPLNPNSNLRNLRILGILTGNGLKIIKLLEQGFQIHWPEDIAKDPTITFRLATVELNCASDLISLLKIIIYFYNQYYGKLMERATALSDFERDALLTKAREEAKELGLNPQRLNSLMKNVAEGLKRLGFNLEKLPQPDEQKYKLMSLESRCLQFLQEQKPFRELEMQKSELDFFFCRIQDENDQECIVQLNPSGTALNCGYQSTLKICAELYPAIDRETGKKTFQVKNATLI